MVLDTTNFPNAPQLQEDSVLGRLKTFTPDMIGDTDGDGDVDEIYSYGARSFSIWDETGDLVWDSGDDFEQYISANFPSFFNCNDGLASEMDDRSDDKGPEPEAVVIGQMGTRFYAFVGLERQGGIMVYNVTDPTNPIFETYIENLDVANGTMTDIAPEGLVFVPASESHTGEHLLIVSSEVSGTTTIYQITDLVSSVEETTSISMAVYPNPTQDILTIEIDTEAAYCINNALGMQVMYGQINKGSSTIHLNNLPSGIYYLTVFDNNNATVQATQKIIKY